MRTPRFENHGLIAALAIALWTLPGAGLAQQVNLDEVMDALVRPAPLTRSLGAPKSGATGEEAEFLRNLPTRGLTVEARQEVVTISKERELPRIDLDIPFEFNSDVLRSDVMPDLVTIGRALTSPELDGNRFLIAGHTDGVGSAEYNQELSERRAASVRDFLVEAFAIPANRLVVVGFGFEQLLNADEPQAAENRRVEVINLEVGDD